MLSDIYVSISERIPEHFRKQPKKVRGAGGASWTPCFDVARRGMKQLG
jgi:hypothetical protein